MTVEVNRKNIGHRIRRLRELRGIKQETLASELGISRQSVSKIEQSETIDDEMLDKISKVLDVTTDTIKNFNEDAIITIISSTLHDNAGSINTNCTLNFNPIEKLVDQFEENKQLYERMLETERSKVKLLEELLKERAK